jgi:hypothetical protein
MTQTFLLLALALVSPGDSPSRAETQRKPSPFAPSLPQLTDEEEEQLDGIIDRFILADTGKLRGDDAKKAVAEFQKLPPESVFALIRGLNRAAEIEHSCPAVTIAKKLAVILNASADPELLEFARENVGAGVTRSRHMGVIKDLRVVCIVRKRALPAKVATVRAAPAVNPLKSMTTYQMLLEAVNPERGVGREQLLKELDGRPRDRVLAELGSVADDSSDKRRQRLTRDVLADYLARQGLKLVKEELRDESPELRAAAARAAGLKGLRLGEDLIDLLSDSEARVRQAAHQALVRLSRGSDFGPEPDAGEKDRAAAVAKWRAWWKQQTAH